MLGAHDPGHEPWTVGFVSWAWAWDREPRTLDPDLDHGPKAAGPGQGP